MCHWDNGIMSGKTRRAEPLERALLPLQLFQHPSNFCAHILGYGQHQTSGKVQSWQRGCPSIKGASVACAFREALAGLLCGEQTRHG